METKTEKESCKIPEEAMKGFTPPPIMKKSLRWKMIWYYLTCWRPLIKYESRKYNIMIMRLSQAVVNLKVTQEKVVKNNNIMVRQLEGQHIAKEMKKEDEAKILNEDVAFQ